MISVDAMSDLDHPMISVDELSRCLLDVVDDDATAIYAAQLAAHRVEYEREARVLDEQMTRQARATVAKLRLHGYNDLGDLLSREEQTRANMWPQVMMGSNVEVYRNVCNSVIHIVMQKAMAMEPFVSQLVGEYISLLQRQHSLTALTALPPPAAAVAVAVAPPPRALAAAAALPAAAAAAGAHTAAAAAAAVMAARRIAHASARGDADDPEPRSRTDGGESTDGGTYSHRVIPTFCGTGAARLNGDLFNTSDTGSEFDPISGSFIDKKAVRRERNKLAAQGYRQRKRATVETIEVELEEVRKQNTALQQQNTVLQTENGLLREQLEFFRKALSGNLGSR
jgi:hypothetical protein